MRGRRQRHQFGISLIEVLVGVTVLSVSLIFINYTITLFVTAREELLADTRALYLAEEGYELVRALRDNNWNSIAGLDLDTYYALTPATTSIAISGTVPEIIDDEYRRSFEVRALYRDADDDIVASTSPGSSPDGNGREVIVRVGGPVGTSTVRGVVTNLFEL